MSAYATRTYNNGDDIKMILNKFKMPILEKPEALDSMEDGVDKDIYIGDINSYENDNRALTTSVKNVYSLFLGQCTESLCAKMKGK